MYFSQQADRLFLPTAKLKEERVLQMVSLPECVAWLTVGLMVTVATVTLNLITIIVFINNGNLRRRSKYLVINLTVVDMLAGGFGAYEFLRLFGTLYCHLWKDSLSGELKDSFFAIFVLFPVASLTNITAISLDRLHATFWPIKHRVIRKWIYGAIIAITWVTAGLVSIANVVLDKFKKQSHSSYSWNSFNSICLLIICISYASILIKVRCRARPQRHGTASRERKLSLTLFIVTFVSLLMYLPYVLCSFFYYATDTFGSLSKIAIRRLNLALLVLFYANSLVNPILYIARMPDFRRALDALFRRRPQQMNQARAIPLRDM